VRRDHDADLGHLTRAVRPGLVMDDHHVAEGENAGADGEPCALCEVLRPGERASPQLERLQEHVAQAQHRRAEAVATRRGLLAHHPVHHQGLQDAVNG